MTDRKPGAPGQFKAVITQGQLQKLQSGEEFVITLSRDDQPITEGTPYSKAAVLPDELAQKVCPDILDPTPADAMAGLLPTNGNGEMAGQLRMGGNKITNVAAPETETDGATKAYVDGKISDHQHSASAITSGTLPIARGGMGKTTHTSNAVLTGNGTSAVNNVATANGAFYATAANGAPTFGTLPIAQGGTGSTSAVNACSALGLSPAMNVGTEYTTREKYKNKVVYAKVVSLDLSTGSGNKYVSVSSSMTECFYFTVYVRTASGAANHISYISGISDCFINVDSGNFFVNSSALSGHTAYALVKYIK